MFCPRSHVFNYFEITAGGTFALYSLICRNAKVNLLPNQLPSDARISGFRLKVPSPELERSLKIKERLESSSNLKKILLLLVLAGTSMVIANGVVTPAMSGYLLLYYYVFCNFYGNALSVCLEFGLILIVCCNHISLLVFMASCCFQ